jgi:hypothetical protein
LVWPHWPGILRARKMLSLRNKNFLFDIFY